MSTWNQAGPVVAEVDGTAENLRVVDFASAEALRSPADGKVAVGTDGTPLSAEALEFASAVAAVREADLVVVRAGLLVRESCDVGLVVVGSRTGGLPTDPVVRRSVAAMTCPVAIVPHRLTRVEWERLQAQTAARRGALVLPTY